jgi:hypothetical protein
MSNGLTLPFSQTIPSLSDSAFSIVVQDGGGTAISGEAYGTDKYGDVPTGVYGETDIGQAIFGVATGSGVAICGQGGQYAGQFNGAVQINGAGQFNGAVQVNDTSNTDAFASTSGSANHAAVAAHNNNGGFAFWGNSDSPSGTGIFARGATQAAAFVQTDAKSNQDGLVSTAVCKGNAAVAAHNNGGGFGFWGSSDSDGGTGIYARGAKLAALFDGAVQVNGNINMGGNDVVFSDCAEQFDVSADVVAEPGTVMVITEDGRLRPSSLAYDRRVAGVVSGAGDFRPGIVLGVMPHSRRSQVAVALVGKVYCKVDASEASIRVGDMLTSSLTEGHAMKAGDPARAFGAVIGKALRPLATGIGLIPILIALQ